MENKEIENLEKVAELASNEGGKYLIEATRSVLIGTIEEIANSYKEKDRDALVSLCARLQANLSLYQLLTGIDTQIDAIKQLMEQK